MPVLAPVEFQLTCDQVLRGQGVDAARARLSRPRLVELTERALAFGAPALRPAAAFERYEVLGLRHDYLLLEGGRSLRGALLREQLAGASQIVAAVCTVGEEITRLSAEVFADDPALGLALDGLASAAVEAAANEICRIIGETAATDGLNASRPFNPGMHGWSVEEGQPQIFSLVDASAVGVLLGETAFMRPLKSLSFVVGLGEQLEIEGEPCELCMLHHTCRYRPAGHTLAAGLPAEASL